MAGLIGHCSKIIRGGRVFSRRIIDYVKGRHTTGSHQVSADFKLDVQWWLECMSRFNGKSNMINTREVTAVVVIARGDWFVFGWGGQTKLCQWDYDDITEPVWRREGELVTLILPLLCVNNRSMTEVMTTIYCAMYFIEKRGVKLCLCCKFLSSISIFNSAKSTVCSQLKALHRFFWWCVDRDVFVEPMHVYL